MVFDDTKQKEYEVKISNAEGKINKLRTRLRQAQGNITDIRTIIDVEEITQNVLKTPEVPAIMGEDGVTIKNPKVDAVFEPVTTPAVTHPPRNPKTYKAFTDAERTKVLTDAVAEVDSIMVEIDKLS